MTENSWTEIRKVSVKTELPLMRFLAVLIKVATRSTYVDTMRVVREVNAENFGVRQHACDELKKGIFW